MTLDDFVRLCADLNLDGTELTSYYFPKDFNDDYLIHLKQLTFRLGLDISGTAIANDFCLPPGEARDKTLAHTRKWIDYAALMGAPVIRIFAGKVPTGDTEEAAIGPLRRGNQRISRLRGQEGSLSGPREPRRHHGHAGADAQDHRAGQGIAVVRVNLDGGNFQTPDPYSDLAKIAPYAINVQLKTDLYPGGKHEEDRPGPRRQAPGGCRLSGLHRAGIRIERGPQNGRPQAHRDAAKDHSRSRITQPEIWRPFEFRQLAKHACPNRFFSPIPSRPRRTRRPERQWSSPSWWGSAACSSRAGSP